MASILASNLSSQQAVQQLSALGVTDTLTAEVPPFAAGPFVTLSLAGKNPAVIRQSMPVVIRFAQQRLRALQENGSIRTPPKGLIGATIIAQPSTPAPVLKRKIELTAGVAALGLMAFFLLSFSAEARAIRRHEESALNSPRQVRNGRLRRGNRGSPEQDHESVRTR